MADSKINGFTVAWAAVGGLLMWSGVKGTNPAVTFRNLLNNKPVSSEPVAYPIEPGDVLTDTAGSSGQGAAIPSTSNAQQALQQAAAAKNWGSGAEWQALQNVEMREAGFNPRIKNPESGALGLAQALGHGNANTAGSLGNEYGGFGLSDAQAKAANSGDAGPQAVWMVNYIAATYGDPIKAWAHEQQYGWY